MLTEQSSRLNREAVRTAERDLARVNSSSAIVQTGTYNVFGARRQLAERLQKLGRVNTIKKLSEQISDLLSFQASLSLHESTEENFVSKAAWLYVRFNQFPLTVESNVIETFLDKAKQIDFDLDTFVTLPKLANEMNWEALCEQHYAVMNQLQSHLSAAVNECTSMIALGNGFGSFSEESVYWFATREDEFTVALEKLRLRRAKGWSSPHLHLGFSRFQEVCHLAKQTYTNETFMKIAKGELRDDESLAFVAESKTASKYATLASFFREGGIVDGLSFDYAFDGLAFRESNPFNSEQTAYAASVHESECGGIECLYLDVGLLCVSFEYVAGGQSSCCGCCGGVPKDEHDRKIRGVKAIRNIFGLFDALSYNGPKRVLRRLSLIGNYLTEHDCKSLYHMLEGSGLQHLNISKVTVEHEGCWSILADCIKNCTRLLTIDLSRLPASDVAHAALLESLESSRETLIELVCDGVLARGNAGDLCKAPISNILSFPRLVSLSMACQSLPNDLIAYASKKLLSNPCMMNMQFADNQHTTVRMVTLKGCCCCQSIFTGFPNWMKCSCCCDDKTTNRVMDRASPAVLGEISNILAENKRNVAHRRIVRVVEMMLQKFRIESRTAEDAYEVLRMGLEQKATEAVRNQELAEHSKKVELAQAAAARTCVAVNAVNATTTAPISFASGLNKLA